MEATGAAAAREDGTRPRLFRETPANAIWEAGGNVQGLDTLRAIEKQPETLEAFFKEAAEAKGADHRFDQFLAQLKEDFTNLSDIQYRARNLVDRLALAMQASLLLRHSDKHVADAFCATRLESHGGLNYGNLPTGTNPAAIIKRATPVVG
ncbi:MAG: DNA alkylation response protein, partial [Alteromonadaceae bacterium]|nr:DNA alkylation response protein [Alteromonadaceae bacterium]